MQTQTMQSGQTSSRQYTNLALTAIACLLGVLVVHTVSQGTSVSIAGAQPDGQGSQVGVVGDRGGTEADSAGLISAAEQRKAMISELRSVSSRLERIEAALARGINVKVTNMPAGGPPSGGGSNASGAGAPATR